MLDYAKVAQKLRKAFPDLSEEEISQMMAKIPSYVPMAAIDGLIAMTKHCMKNPAKRKLLSVKCSHKQDFTPSSDAS